MRAEDIIKEHYKKLKEGEALMKTTYFQEAKKILNSNYANPIRISHLSETEKENNRKILKNKINELKQQFEADGPILLSNDMEIEYQELSDRICAYQLALDIAEFNTWNQNSLRTNGLKKIINDYSNNEKTLERIYQIKRY